MADCRCTDCFTLREYLQSLGRPPKVWERLPKAPGHRASLRVLTFGNDDTVVEVAPCAGGYTCECEDCKAERRQIKPRPTAKQPWDLAA